MGASSSSNIEFLERVANEKRQAEENLRRVRQEKEDLESQLKKIHNSATEKEQKEILRKLKEKEEQEEKKKSELDEDEKRRQSYDAQIHINSVDEGIDGGWWVESYMSTKKPVVWNGYAVGIIGQYDRGKSFILNNLCNVNFMSGYTVNTKGLSIKSMQGVKKHVILDTAGLNSPVQVEIPVENNKNPLQDYFQKKKKTEDFITSLILKLADYMIIVVDGLSWQEQQMIFNVSKHRYDRGHDQYSEVFVVHNMKNITSLPDLFMLFKQRCSLYEADDDEEDEEDEKDEKDEEDEKDEKDEEMKKKELHGIRTDTVIVDKSEHAVEYFWSKSANARHVCLGNHESMPLHNRIVFALLRKWIDTIVMKENHHKEVTLKPVLEAIRSIAPDFYQGEISKIDIGGDNKILLTGTDLTSKKDNAQAFSGVEKFSPKFCIEEIQNEYIVTLEVPSFVEDMIGLEIGNSTAINHFGLLVTGEKVAPNAPPIKNTRQYGEFAVHFDIPLSYKRQLPSCIVENGVATLTFEKDQVVIAKPKQSKPVVIKPSKTTEEKSKGI